MNETNRTVFSTNPSAVTSHDKLIKGIHNGKDEITRENSSANCVGDADVQKNNKGPQ